LHHRKPRTPGKNGRIAFRRYFDNGQRLGAIFTINVDGSGERRVTHAAKGLVDDQPDWSLKGSLLAFSRCVPDGRVPCTPCVGTAVAPTLAAALGACSQPVAGGSNNCFQDLTFTAGSGSMYRHLRGVVALRVPASSPSGSHRSLIVVGRLLSARREAPLCAAVA
jgi:hypothetical protein